jgi:hypothetical protein
MLEIGFNAGGQSPGPGGNGITWGTVWGGSHPGPWYSDPRPLLINLIKNFGNPPDYIAGMTGTSTQADILTNFPLWLANTFTSIQTSIVNATEEIGIFVIALVIITLGVFVLFREQITGLGKKAGEAAILA